ncbi:MAG TPA: discoidin domain-containing protein [Chthoniobacteraceae bacterium]|nr:discoidin domain-containing protein [Chthoniobacteraceae bacterium]
MKKLLLLPILSLALWNVSACADAVPLPERNNLAAGLRATFDPAPNYQLCKDPGDALQLTDGFFAGAESTGKPNETLWVQKQTVGWANPRRPIVISFDLGEEKEIEGVMVSSAAGSSNVAWPAAIGFFVSPDGKTWSYAGEVISGSLRHGLPPSMSYSEHRFVADGLKARGRHVALCIPVGGSLCFFADEIAFYEGPSGKAAPSLPVVGNLAAMREFIYRDQVALHTLRRLKLDYDAIGEAIHASSLAATDKNRLNGKLEALAAACAQPPGGNLSGFSTVIPINATQEKLLAIHGELLEKQGYPPLFLSKIHRNGYLGWLAAPELTRQEPITLRYRQMSGETRADLFLVTNASPEAATVTLSLEQPADALDVAYCPWTDTPQLEPVATALLPAEKTGDGWRFSIPPGLTMKVLVNLDGSKLPPGRHEFKAAIRGTGTADLPVRLEVDLSPVKMRKPGLHLGMWDYVNGRGYHAITPQNRQAALRLMRSHGVDSPWGKFSDLPMPGPDDFDAAGKLITENLNFTLFDQWLELWPDAARYLVFVNVTRQIGGVRIDSPGFEPRVAQWARAVADHAASRGLKPGVLNLHLVDEPHTDDRDRLFTLWAAAVRKAAPELTLWCNPTRVAPQNAPVPEVFDLPDVLSPNARQLVQGGRKALEFYRGKRKEGKALELYLCSALAPHTDPNHYYRMLPWSGWPLRIQGVGFWSFGSTGGLASNWNAYENANGLCYAPAFFSRDDVTDTLQWQAVREGVLDYEYFRMLDEALPTAPPGLKQKAEELLSDDAIADCFGGWTAIDNRDWRVSSGQEAPDLHREKILQVLEEIATRSAR